MNAKERIIDVLKNQDGWLTASEIDERAKIQRPSYTSRLLASLLDEKKVVQRKEGRNVYYMQNSGIVFLEDDLDLTHTAEDKVFARARGSELYAERVSDQADTIFEFAFTEMLNNAKDHSKSGAGYVKIWEEEGKLKFIVKDHGVGVFRQIMHSRKLKNEVEAIQDLVKGKVTTSPRRHSGEGIFWTSKLADKFTLSSYQYVLFVDNLVDDYTIAENEDADCVVGTQVEFEIAADSKKSVAEIFREFSLSRTNYSFDTTEVPLKLYNNGDFWVSRSQAKRVLAGLEKYKKVIIDFKGIELVGQGFADEIFRVFQIAHPEIVLEPVNMNSNVRMLVERAINDQTGRD